MNVSDRTKQALKIVGITIAVYLIFQYILPLVIPFLIAWIIAALIAPIVKWLEKHVHIKRVLAAGLIVLLLGVLLFSAGGWLIGKLLSQLKVLLEQLPVYETILYERIASVCLSVEEHFGLSEHIVMDSVNDGMQRAAEWMEERAMPVMVSNSVPAIKWVAEVVTVSLVTFVSIIFISREFPEWKEGKTSFLFSDELKNIIKKLSAAGGAYVKTQGIIMLITSTVCTAGFLFMKNPYALLLGIGIGLMDALPLLGTGLVFIPWIIGAILCKNLKSAIWLVVIYLICYLTREFLEPKLMGEQIGIGSLEMIISMYVGLKLFGLAGVLLGPVGYLIIKESSLDEIKDSEKA